MKKIAVLFSVIVLCSVCSIAYALYSVADKGLWPDDWPKQLEPLRTQARTMVGPMAPQRHYLIPFTQREQFEAAWPHILKIKSKGAPIFLISATKERFMAVKPAGVVIHSPPKGTDKKANPEEPVAGNWGKHERSRWMWTNYIELVVDGDVVDLNRIALPEDTPIIDERFEASEEKPEPKTATSVEK